MKKLDETIDRFFSENDGLTLKTLFEEVEKVIDLFDLRRPINEQAEEEDELAKAFEKAVKDRNVQELLPTIKITEAWGRLGKNNRDRTVIE